MNNCKIKNTSNKVQDRKILMFVFSHCFLVADPASSNKSCPPLPARCGVASRLMVTPLVSGLERSQEKSQESHFPESVSSSTSSAPFSCLPSNSPATASVTRPSPINGNSSRHNGSPPLSKPKPFVHGGSHSIYNLNNRYVFARVAIVMNLFGLIVFLS